MDWKWNEQGFTFIEMLLILSILMITLPFIVYMMHHIQTTPDHDDISVQQLFVHLRNDVLRTKSIHASDDRLYFITDENETASIDHYDQVIRRRVEGKGHEIYVRDINSFQVQTLPYGFRLTVTTLQGATYEKILAAY